MYNFLNERDKYYLYVKRYMHTKTITGKMGKQVKKIYLWWLLGGVVS